DRLALVLRLGLTQRVLGARQPERPWRPVECVVRLRLAALPECLVQRRRSGYWRGFLHGPHCCAAWTAARGRRYRLRGLCSPTRVTRCGPSHGGGVRGFGRWQPARPVDASATAAIVERVSADAIHRPQVTIVTCRGVGAPRRLPVRLPRA